ncbi:hypothetical protein [Brevibacillus daliensis]|uniref:hypothetical protein n=1 Tax=Brevibacillus daliensis TaxID=2892995 RepID=UPI001E34D73A|nr:hypothetical protein [Brevibacillus daliensis]
MTRSKIARLFLLLALIINTLALLVCIGTYLTSTYVYTHHAFSMSDIPIIFLVFNGSAIPLYFLTFIVWMNNNEAHHYQE